MAKGNKGNTGHTKHLCDKNKKAMNSGWSYPNFNEIAKSREKARKATVEWAKIMKGESYD